MARERSAIGPPVDAADLRALRHDLAVANDAQLRRVVELIDAMSARGEADRLIAPLRPRLVGLRLRRPLGLPRLLFLPLDALIVPPATWRRNAPGIPRTVLLPFAHQVCAGAPDIVGTVEAHIAGRTTADEEAIRAAGAMLWPAAARALGEAVPPVDWSEATGLTAADHAALSGAVAFLLGHAVPLARLALRDGDEAEQMAAIAPMLAAGTRAGALPLAMLLVMMMTQLPRAGQLMALIRRSAGAQGGDVQRRAADQAVEFALDGVQAAAPRPGGLDELRRLAGLLADLRAEAVDQPARRQRADALRRALDGTCRRQFDTALQTDIIDRLGDAAAADDLEAAGRLLRRFEMTARRLGGGAHYAEQLQRATERVLAAQGPEGLAWVDRARLVEILAGPEAAWPLLSRAGQGPADQGAA